MPANYNGNPAAILAHVMPAISCPVDADPRNANSANTPLQKLADVLAYLQSHALLRDVADTISALTTVTGAAGDTNPPFETAVVPTARKLLWRANTGWGYARLYASLTNAGFELTNNALWDGAQWVRDTDASMVRIGIASTNVLAGINRDGFFYFDTFDGAVASEANFAAKRIRWGNPESRYAWTNAVLLNAWVAFGGTTYAAAHRVASNGVGLEGELSGSIKSGAIGTVALNLPAGVRPVQEVQVPCASNGALGILTIATNGDVTVTAGSNVRVDLNGVRFRLS